MTKSGYSGVHVVFTATGEGVTAHTEAAEERAPADIAADIFKSLGHIVRGAHVIVTNVDHGCQPKTWHWRSTGGFELVSDD